MSTASPVRALSEMLGVWCGPGSSGPHHDPGARVYHRVAAVRDGQRYRWEVRPTGAGGIHVMRWEPDEATGVRMVGEWTLTEAEAPLWLLLYAIPTERDTCPDCEGLCGLIEHEQTSVDDDRPWNPHPWPVPADTRAAVTGGAMCYPEAFACTTCTGPTQLLFEEEWSAGHVAREHAQYHTDRGRGVEQDGPRLFVYELGQPRGHIEVHTWARRLLGAMPTAERQSGNGSTIWHGGDFGVTRERMETAGWTVDGPRDVGGGRYEWSATKTTPGNAEDRDELAVLADRLQAGDGPELFADDGARLLGEALALWLTQAPCEDISCVLDCPDQCASCGGSGLALGALVPALTDLAQWIAETAGGQS